MYIQLTGEIILLSMRFNLPEEIRGIYELAEELLYPVFDDEDLEKEIERLQKESRDHPERIYSLARLKGCLEGMPFPLMTFDQVERLLNGVLGTYGFPETFEFHDTMLVPGSDDYTAVLSLLKGNYRKE